MQYSRPELEIAKKRFYMMISSLKITHKRLLILYIALPNYVPCAGRIACSPGIKLPVYSSRAVIYVTRAQKNYPPSVLQDIGVAAIDFASLCGSWQTPCDLTRGQPIEWCRWGLEAGVGRFWDRNTFLLQSRDLYFLYRRIFQLSEIFLITTNFL